MIRPGTGAGPSLIAAPSDSSAGPLLGRPVLQCRSRPGVASFRSVLGAFVSGGAGIVVFYIGRQALPLPGSWSVQAWEQWWSSAGPLVAVFAVARGVLVVAAVILAVVFVVVAVAVAGAGAGRPGMAARLSAARRWPGFGPVLRLAIAAGATGAALAGCGSGPSGPGSGGAALSVVPPAPTLTNSGAAGHRSAASSEPGFRLPAPPAVPVTGPGSGGGPPPVARTLGPRRRSPGSPPGSPPPVALSAPPVAVGAPGRWVVGAGDSLWSIAEATVGPHSGQVAAYWVAMIDLNRPTLPDPSDPSLLFAGDVVLLPPRLGN